MIRTTYRPWVLSLALGFCAFLINSASSAQTDIPRPEHPEPMAVRPHWSNLNGTWNFRFDAMDEGRNAEWFKPGAAGFDRRIVVPFPWESELSGVHKVTGAPKVGWYRRSFQIPVSFPKDQRVWLRFGAVDYRADVWINGQKVAEHEGGYSPFGADITDVLKRDAGNTLVVRAFDPTDPSLPVGKQVGWYTTTSGIWQTVWLEARPKTYISTFTIKTSLDPATISVSATLAGTEPGKTYTLNLTVPPDGSGWTAAGSAEAKGDTTTIELKAQVPAAQVKLWTPESPNLYDAKLTILANPDTSLDTVQTYFGLRTIARGKYGDEPFERILLNGKPVYLRMALDQSFNPKGIYTAPTDEFLRKDLELAKQMGLNGLRIHIKPEEPRRLYWADKLGLLIMEDMPNAWRQNAKARESWEKTMREVVARDKNHPSIFSWVAFNETWGLGRPEDYKADRDTQDWVKRMVAEIRTLDDTRLVEDNSPCNYDHVSVTDLNSWHFYIDNHEASKRHIAEVVAKSTPGSSFNHCPGEAMNTAPLINSEYGSVSAGGGDRDVSWGFRDLTTQLRKHNKIQGYVYTELTDIEWEHNGFANYDRTLKDFGYDAFVPGMTVADLQGADFIGYDAPPAITAKVDEIIYVPLFVSHYSDRVNPPTLKWWIKGVDEWGENVDIPARERPVEWTPYGVKEQKRLGFKIDRPFVGALALTLVDSSGHRIAANFVNLVVKPETPRPRIEKLGPRDVAIRFSPADLARSTWSGGWASPAGKVSGRGVGSFFYRFNVPTSVIKAKPVSFELLAEVSAEAGRERVDWPERVNSQDNPQTDVRKWPSELQIALNGQRAVRVTLPDDPADARGVLSHLKGFDHGSYGEKIQVSAALPEQARNDINAGRPLMLRFSVPDDAVQKGGLTLFGADTGRYPADPVIVLHTEDELPDDLGVPPEISIAVDTIAQRHVSILLSGDELVQKPPEWSYTTDDPGPNWQVPSFDDKAWQRGRPGFGTAGTPALKVGTTWNNPTIWLRTKINIPQLNPDDLLTLHLFHDEDVEIFVNGKRLLNARGYITSYTDIPLDDTQKALFQPGANTIAVRCRQTGGGQGVDVGLRLLRGQ